MLYPSLFSQAQGFRIQPLIPARLRNLPDIPRKPPPRRRRQIRLLPQPGQPRERARRPAAAFQHRGSGQLPSARPGPAPAAGGGGRHRAPGLGVVPEQVGEGPSAGKELPSGSGSHFTEREREREIKKNNSSFTKKKKKKVVFPCFETPISSVGRAASSSKNLS